MSYLEGVRIDYDTADIITRLTLIESLKGINKNIAALEKKNNMAGHWLKDHEKEDLEYNLKYREALLVIIEYFSTPGIDSIEDQMKEMKDD